jgi:hypothetical protein
MEGINENWPSAESKTICNLTRDPKERTSTRTWLGWWLGGVATDNQNLADERREDMEEVLSSDGAVESTANTTRSEAPSPVPRSDHENFPHARPPTSFFRFLGRVSGVIATAVAEATAPPMHATLEGARELRARCVDSSALVRKS